MSVEVPPGIFSPKCCQPGCDDWGSWGYGCTREIGTGQWFCYRHRPSDEAPAVAAPHASTGSAQAPNPLPARGEREEKPKRFPGGLF